MRLVTQIVSLYTSHRAIVSLFFTMLIIEIMFFARFVWPTIFQIIIERHVFEIIVLLALAQIILFLFKLYQKPPKVICKNEFECQLLLRDFVQTESRAVSLHILSSGLRSRYDLLMRSPLQSNGKLKIEVLAQDPRSAPDKIDAERWRHDLDDIKRSYNLSLSLELRLFAAPATLRAMLVCDDRRVPIWGVASWYLYGPSKNEKIKVSGRSNPSILYRVERSPDDAEILRFLMQVFEDQWEDCKEHVFFNSLIST